MITDVCNDESKEQKSSMQNKITFGVFNIIYVPSIYVPSS